MLLVAVLYTFFYCILAWVRPDLALLGIFAIAPVQTDLGKGSFSFSIAEVNLALTGMVFLIKVAMGQRTFTLGPMRWPIFAYFAVCVFSSLATWRNRDAVVSTGQMFLYVIIATVVFAGLPRNARDVKVALYGLVCTGTVWAIIGMMYHFRFEGHNKNGMGSTYACAFLVTLELFLSATEQRTRLLLGVALAIISAALLMALSRGAWLGAICGTVLIGSMRRQWTILLRTCAIVLPIFVICWNLLPQESKTYATELDKGRYSINERYKSVDIAERYFAQNPLYGVGVGLRKQYDATNLVWSTLAETGVLGLLCFLSIYVAYFSAIWRARSRFQPDDPLFSLLVIGSALMLDKFAHGMVDHYWSRGALTMAWCGAGMSVGAIYLQPLTSGTQTRMEKARRALAVLTLAQLHLQSLQTSGVAAGGGSPNGRKKEIAP